MDFNNLWKRAEMGALRNFLKYGAENISEMSDKSYTEQIRAAEKGITKVIAEKFSENEEEKFNLLIEDIENAYFEIGLLMGGKIIFQVMQKFERDK